MARPKVISVKCQCHPCYLYITGRQQNTKVKVDNRWLSFLFFWWSWSYYKCHLLSDGAQLITNVIYYLMELNLLQMWFTIWCSSTYYKCDLLSDGAQPITNVIYTLMELNLLQMSFTIWWHTIYYKCHLLSDGTQIITHVIHYLMALKLLQMSFTIVPWGLYF